MVQSNTMKNMTVWFWGSYIAQLFSLEEIRYTQMEKLYN